MLTMKYLTTKERRELAQAAMTKISDVDRLHVAEAVDTVTARLRGVGEDSATELVAAVGMWLAQEVRR